MWHNGSFQQETIATNILSGWHHVQIIDRDSLFTVVIDQDTIMTRPLQSFPEGYFGIGGSSNGIGGTAYDNIVVRNIEMQAPHEGSQPSDLPVSINGVVSEVQIADFVKGMGDWQIVNGTLVQQATDYDGPVDRVIVYNPLSAESLSISTDVTVTADNGGSNYSIGLLFKAKDLNNYFYVYTGQSGEVAVAKYINATWSLLHSQSFDSLPIGVTRNLKVVLSDTGLQVSTDNTVRYTVQISMDDFSGGSFGFLTGWGASGKFENIHIMTPTSMNTNVAHLSLGSGASSAFGAPGDTLRIPLTLTSFETPIGGLQLDIPLTDGIPAEFVALEDSTGDFGFTGAYNTFSDTTRLIFHSPAASLLPAGTVTLGRLVIRLDPAAPLGSTHTLRLANVQVSDSLGILLPDSLTFGELQVGIRGDLNLDGQVSILDVIRIARIIVGKEVKPDSVSTAFHIADMDISGIIDVSDIIRQVHTILHITKQIVAPAPTTALIRFGDAQASSSGSLVMPVELQSDGLIAGLQATVRFDPSTVSVGIPQLTGPAVGLSLDASIHDGVLRLVVFGTQPGQGIVAGSGAVLLIPITLRSGATEPPSFELSDVVVASVQAQRIPVTIGTPVKAAALPTAFSLGVNRPNPFNPSTTIAYDVPQQAHITLAVYNVLGQEVVRLVNSVQQAGRYTVMWDARNAQGQAVSSGVYLYRLSSSTGFVESRRMVLLK